MKIITLLLLVLAGWQIYGKYSTPVITNADLELLNTPSNVIKEEEPFFDNRYSEDSDSEEFYSCDGRQHCSQMSSCEEATFFIENCPNTKMDGDNDGIPCERQFCGH